MRIAMIGLGRMGANIARRLMLGKHEVVAFDRNEKNVAELAEEGAIAAASLEEVAAKFDGAPRIFWVMLPAGEPTESTIEAIMKLSLIHI
jgi:6-phosphogluconate dehydrogenase